jgi:hypothetical protein
MEFIDIANMSDCPKPQVLLNYFLIHAQQECHSRQEKMYRRGKKSNLFPAKISNIWGEGGGEPNPANLRKNYKYPLGPECNSGSTFEIKQTKLPGIKVNGIPVNGLD